MLTFNRPQFIGRAIQSMLDQHFQGWELIVVQDGNNAATIATMQSWAKGDPRIRYFHREKPGNIANACNYAIQRSRGEYIAILDDDDFWPIADKLDKQLAFLDTNREYVGCGGGVLVIDEHETPTLRYMKPESDAEIKRNALYANPMAHSTTMFRKKAAQQVGGYDETLAGFQDWDLWLKLGRIGKLYNFQEVFLNYTLWTGGGSFMQQRGNTQSALRIVQRHRKDYPAYWIALPVAFLYHCYSYVPVWIKRHTFPVLSRAKKALTSGAKQPKSI